MRFRQRTVTELADMICGNDVNGYFQYRTGAQLESFFKDCDVHLVWEGSSRKARVEATLEAIVKEPAPGPNIVPDTFQRVVRFLMEQEDAKDEPPERQGALAALNTSLKRDGFEAFFGPDHRCYLRHLGTNAVASESPNPHRPFSEAEVAQRKALELYLADASEDELIEEVLVPLFRRLGFQRVTAPGHRDRALEYGKDLWMRFTLPIGHVLYFGIQAKKGRIDSTGAPRSKNNNVAEIYNQALMMLGHAIFDQDSGKRVLVDHAMIVAGGEITKAARNWLGEKLDAAQRSQIIFMERSDILDLYVVSGLPVPSGAPAPDVPWLADNGLDF
jgi:hypothetical protein